MAGSFGSALLKLSLFASGWALPWRELLCGEAKLLRLNTPTNLRHNEVNTAARSRNDSQIGTTGHGCLLPPFRKRGERLEHPARIAGSLSRWDSQKLISILPPIIFLMPFKRARKTYDGESLYEYAVQALARQMRTVAEIKRLMRKRVKDQEHGELLVEMVIARLKEQKYLNDTSYAENYSRFRKENEKFGRMRVIQDLKIKGVHGDIIDSVVSAAYGDVNEEHLAREFLQRKRMVKPEGQKQAARVFRTLMRAGFSSRVIFRILKKWDVDDETLSALEEEVSG
jgi:regulatory protein